MKYSLQLSHDEFGTIRLTLNARAKNIIFRYREGELHLTAPQGITEKELREAIDRNKSLILQLREKTNKRKPTENPLFVKGEQQMLTFRARLTPQSVTPNLRFRLHEGILSIEYPANRSLSQEILRKKILQVVDHYLRSEAKRVLPEWTQLLAQQHGVSIREVKINGSRGRWGSCSSEGNINLSYHLLQKPRHLVEYVILHELAHRSEMNHSPRFWTILDGYCNGMAKKLRRELNHGV